MDSEPQSQVAEEETSYAKTTLDQFSRSSYTRVLDIIWVNQTDDFLFDCTDLIVYVRQLPPSKRSVLKFTAKIHDSLGLLSPFMIRLKVLFQVLCTNQPKWDQPLQGEVLDVWNNTTIELACKDSQMLFLLVRLILSYMNFATHPFKHMLP